MNRPARIHVFRLFLPIVVAMAVLAPDVRAQSATQAGTAVQTAHESAASGPGVSAAEAHEDTIAPVLLGVMVIILAARVGGHVFEVLRQPPVLGELVVGVVLGNLSLVGFHGLDFLKLETPAAAAGLPEHLRLAGISIDHLSRIGIILLLFQVGLEAHLADFRRVGLSAFRVAVLGVIAPLILGFGAGAILLPSRGWPVFLFLGAALSATSVGITARVLRDLGRASTRESQIVLGAAVIDDVLGLLVLSVVQGIVLSLGDSSGGFSLIDVVVIVSKAVGFLIGALAAGQFVSRAVFKAASYLQGGGMLTVTALAICFFFAWLASRMGLAPIVGAFAAGLILEKVQYRELARRQERHELEDLIRPIADLLVPIFFVMMGLQVDLRTLADPRAMGLAAVLFVAAVVGKQVCSFGALEKGLDRLSIGIGMIPRGEVGLIFAAIGRRLQLNGTNVVDDGTYSALVLVVMATTLVTPPLLKISVQRYETARAVAKPSA
ncbi:cation:proton antiporter [Aquisphaera insulae]|uniref:cation:proton antiporter n=1 Tax=Aquisphaera insulae TaxID=2712864 RepID=UPI0013EB1BF6|nr:cation:proton antiporter [Aquisphaera insulae]